MEPVLSYKMKPEERRLSEELRDHIKMISDIRVSEASQSQRSSFKTPVEEVYSRQSSTKNLGSERTKLSYEQALSPGPGLNYSQTLTAK